ncbi:hypothetical protein KQX54_016693 [Cotesia glomerata]|uniref:Uncharacterized protein n=1 Tax=Cotesia glomerata TaxID=32391 RepID=A0AAV7IRH3_COTGL|nr:hypothetical protein KQX54_016693 [Cotesia glomerata]
MKDPILYTINKLKIFSLQKENCSSSSMLCSNRCHITCTQLLTEVRKNNISFYGRSEILRKVLHDIGFKNIKRNNNRYLVEQPYVIAARIEFLAKYKKNMDALKLKDTNSVLVDSAKATDSEKLVDSTNDTESEMSMSVDPAKNNDSEKLVDPAEDARSFIFLDETWVFRYWTGKTREWQDSSTRSVSVKKASSGPRYIVCHAGGRNGFVDGAGLFVNSSKKINPLDLSRCNER